MIPDLISHFKSKEDKATHSLEITSAIDTLTAYKHLIVPEESDFNCAQSSSALKCVLYDPKSRPKAKEEENN